MNPDFRLLPLAAALAACAVGPDTSYVTSLSAPSDASVMAAGIGSFMRTQLPAASTTIVIDPTPRSRPATHSRQSLQTACGRRVLLLLRVLRQPIHTASIWVTPIDTSGELFRLMIDGRKKASQFFVRNTVGNLQTGGPFTVAQMEASR